MSTLLRGKMRAYTLFVFAYAILLADNASTADVASQLLNIGDTLHATVETSLLPENSFSCNLKTPSGQTIQFRPNNEGDPKKYQLRPYNSLNGCAVSVSITDKSDEGEWQIFYTPINGNGSSRSYTITLNSTDNASSADVASQLLNIGDTLHATVETSLLPENSFSCNLKTPSGQTIQFRPNNEGDPKKYQLRPYNSLNGCAVSVSITDKSDEGVWQIFYTPINGNGSSRSYKVTLNSTDIEEVTPKDVIREIEYLNEEFLNTTLGNKHELKINYFDFVNTESCHIRTPEGVEYDLKETTLEKIKMIQNHNIACGVEINISNENFVGNWTLFSRDTRLSRPIERRLPFTIYIEEIVRAFPEHITVAEGNDLHIRLGQPTELYNTCKIIGPDGNAPKTFEISGNHKTECGFIVPKVGANDSGIWEIVFGDKIIHKAPVHVLVKVSDVKDEPMSLIWEMDTPVDQFVGPSNAVYCRVADPSGLVVFDGFGRCHITMERAQDRHAGIWALTVGTPGNVLTVEQQLQVTVQGTAPRPRVVTSVVAPKPDVLLTCSLQGSQLPIRSCKFREPSGRVLLAAQGVGEGRYTFHGVDVSLESKTASSECGLRITNPVFDDLGLWRCAVETEDNQVYYGFLKVICPFAISMPNAPPVVTEPILTATRSEIWATDGETVTMSCSVQSEISYCYFRARNGTVFNVTPNSASNSLEYVGGGFDAGECGARMQASINDAGAWSCHVGLPGATTPDQRANFTLEVYRPLTVKQTLPSPTDLTITAQTFNEQKLEYCRFVRIDGFGFTSQAAPERYRTFDSFFTGMCGMSVQMPSMLDHHPWTVFAKIVGHEEEVFGTTSPTMQIPSPTPRPTVRFMPINFVWLLWIPFILTLVFLALRMPSRQTLKNVYNRASMRSSIRKMPLDDQTPPEYTRQQTPPQYVSQNTPATQTV